MSNLYIIGGANGSGKTTTAKKILPWIIYDNSSFPSQLIAERKIN